ncbi:uncharacterized protein ACIBXB_009533 isoform 1-T1 [Morphnus guianensis]
MQAGQQVRAFLRCFGGSSLHRNTFCEVLPPSSGAGATPPCMGPWHRSWFSHPAPTGASSPCARAPCDPPPSPGSPDADIPQTELPDSHADLRVRPGCGRGQAPQAVQLPQAPRLGREPLHPSQRQTWVFRSKELMLKSGSTVPEGSLVYVREGSSAYLRTPTGWSRLLLEDSESLFVGDDPSASTPRYQEAKQVKTRGPDMGLPALAPTDSLVSPAAAPAAPGGTCRGDGLLAGQCQPGTRRAWGRVGLGRVLHPWHKDGCPWADLSCVIPGPEGGGTRAAPDPANHHRTTDPVTPSGRPERAPRWRHERDPRCRPAVLPAVPGGSALRHFPGVPVGPHPGPGLHRQENRQDPPRRQHEGPAAGQVLELPLRGPGQCRPTEPHLLLQRAQCPHGSPLAPTAGLARIHAAGRPSPQAGLPGLAQLWPWGGSGRPPGRGQAAGRAAAQLFRGAGGALRGGGLSLPAYVVTPALRHQ